LRCVATSGRSSTREGLQLDLVGRARRGDRDAFDRLIDLHAADLYRLAVAVVGPDAAEDVTQDALVRAWRDLPRLRDDDRFLAWTRRILVRCARDLQRRDGRRRRLVRVDAIDARGPDDAGDDDHAAATDRMTDIHRALSRLTLEQRAVVALHYLADLSLVDVAATLGIPLGTAKSRLHAGLGVLRRELGDAP
jgi:RNA polymerase sigma-70 factor (ECF subfamily)